MAVKEKGKCCDLRVARRSAFSLLEFFLFPLRSVEPTNLQTPMKANKMYTCDIPELLCLTVKRSPLSSCLHKVNEDGSRVQNQPVRQINQPVKQSDTNHQFIWA